MLTDKQKMFCKEYIVDLNATQAAIRAGYSPNSANEQAARMLAKDSIQEYLVGLKSKRSERVEITADMVLKELAKIGFSDLADYLNEDYELKPLEELKDKSQAIQSIQTDTTTSPFSTTKTVKFKLHDKLSALEKIAKHIGFFEKDNSQLKGLINLAPEIKVYNSAPPLSSSEDEIKE